MEVKIQVRGLTELVRKVNGLESGIEPALRDSADRAEKYLLNAIPPPPPPTQRYTRTGLLENSFMGKVTPVSRGYAVTISNPTAYAPWVISDNRIAGIGPQTSIHRGRWYTLQQVLKKSAAGVLEIYQDSLRRLMG